MRVEGRAQKKNAGCRPASPITWRSEPRSGVERLAAAASTLRVRVLELETGAGQPIDVVDPSPVEVQQRPGIDEHLQAAHFNDLVVGTGGLVQGHLILKARASTPDDGNAEPALFASLGQN